MSDVETAALLIRIGVSSVQVLFGLSQQRSPEDWLGYIPKPIQFIMPIKPAKFMRIHSLGNLGIGIWLLSGLALPVAIWVSLLWWIWILPFAFYKAMSIGLRDFAIIMSLIALLLLV